MGVDLNQEQNIAKMVRDQYLRHTRIGRYAVDLFYANEERALERLANTHIEENDRAHARKLYDKYREEGFSVFAQGEKSDKTLTEHHLKDAEAALKRAHKYLSKDEINAAEELFSLAKKYALGKNVRQVLALLNDEKLAKHVSDIIDKVDFVKKVHGRCC